MESERTSSSFGRRVLAIVVLAVAAWILLKFAIGIIAGLTTVIVIVLAIVAVVWAVRTL
jgi:uncharacterized membrane protein